MWNNGYNYNSNCNSNKCSCGCCNKQEDKKIICKCEEMKQSNNSCGCNQNFGYNNY